MVIFSILSSLLIFYFEVLVLCMGYDIIMFPIMWKLIFQADPLLVVLLVIRLFILFCLVIIYNKSPISDNIQIVLRLSLIYKQSFGKYEFL